MDEPLCCAPEVSQHCWSVILQYKIKVFFKTFIYVSLWHAEILLLFLSKLLLPCYNEGFSGGSEGKESACNVGDLGSNPGLGKSPGGGHGNPF